MKREMFATGHEILGESVVSRPPRQQLSTAGAEDEQLKTMDAFVLPLIEKAKTDEEKAYLRQFLGKECKVGVDYFSPVTWTDFWQRLSADFASKQSSWNKDYEKRMIEKRKDRIRENQGVESEIGKVFSPEKAEQLWGPDWKKVTRKINGYVLEKKNDVYLVEWAVPERKTERVVHHGTADLDPVYPDEYVPDFDEFKYIPDEPLSPETWFSNCVIDHPLLVIVETKASDEYRRIDKLLKGCQYGILDLSSNELPVEDRTKLREVIVNQTNWPTFPQLFISATFVGGLENLEGMHEDGSLETVLVMAGVKQKHIVNKEVDKYNEMVEEAVREWRYKQIDQITKFFQREEAKRSELKQRGGKDFEDFEKVREATKAFRDSKKVMLKRLQTNDRVEELFFDDYRQRFLDESAMEIERLTGEIQEKRELYQIPDDDERITLPLLYELTQHKYFAKSPVREKIECLYRDMYPNAVGATTKDKVDIVAILKRRSSPSGEASADDDDVRAGEESVLESVSEEEAREEVDGMLDESRTQQWERHELVELIKEVNKHMEEKWSAVKKKKFYTDHFSKYLSPDVAE